MMLHIARRIFHGVRSLEVASAPSRALPGGGPFAANVCFAGQQVQHLFGVYVQLFQCLVWNELTPAENESLPFQWHARATRNCILNIRDQCGWAKLKAKCLSSAGVEDPHHGF